MQSARIQEEDWFRQCQSPLVQLGHVHSSLVCRQGEGIASAVSNYNVHASNTRLARILNAIRVHVLEYSHLDLAGNVEAINVCTITITTNRNINSRGIDARGLFSTRRQSSFINAGDS
jgi:hypothetical protein